MKHTLSITFVILGMFFLAQLIGIGILSQSIDRAITAETGKTTFKPMVIGERPPVDEKTSFLPIIIAILMGTGILFVLIKYKLVFIWKFWFLIAVVIALTEAFGVFIHHLVAFIIASVLGAWKILKPNVYIHNFTELFIYGGLAAIFVPILNLWSMSILLVLIAIYDAYAVWKSKHMVTLAQSQAEAKVFAGLLIPYQKEKIKRSRQEKTSSTLKKIKVRNAILGGGDIAFPLLFAGVVLKEMGLWQSLVIPFFALGGLAFLLFIAKENKFYPAMPFISAGCFVGLGVVWLINII